MRSVQCVIARFGGPSQLAEKLAEISGEGISGSAIYKWRYRGQIGRNWEPHIVALAKRDGIPLTADDLLRLRPVSKAKIERSRAA